MIVEVCVDSVHSASNAVRGGCHRLELCGNLGVGGGTTPSLGLLRIVRKAHPLIPIMIMIRPRTGDFLYSEEEFDIMLEDARIFKEEGNVQGIVVGVLTPAGRVDVSRTKRIIEAAKPLEVCFHRAIDMTIDIEQALHDVSSIHGITRVLTSGGQPSVSSSLPALAQLLAIVAQTGGISVMPGSGINSRTVGPLLGTLKPHGLIEVHLSGAGWVDGQMEYRPVGMGMGVGGGGDWGIWTTSEENVRDVVQQVNALDNRF